MENYNIENIVDNMIPPIQPLVESLQAKATVKLSNTNPFEIKQDGSEFAGVKTSEQLSKPSIEYRVDAREAYSEVGGEMFRNFPSYMPGRDNYEFAAQNQATWDKWANGLTKASANMLTTVVGNTAGIVYGGINGITEGSWNAVFDNNFSNALADWNDKLNAQLPNYVSKQEQNEGFFGSLDNANFWANDVMGGLSFTLGTVVSEAIWAYATGGAGNIARAGLKGAQATRWGLGAERTAKGIVGYRKFLDDGLKKLYTGSLDPVMKNASLYANTAKGLNTARFLATTSGNEAGIEALHYKREMKEKFYDNFEELNGRQPTQEEIDEFENNLENSANAVFATNMAILMPSNLAMFGSMFNISKPFKGITKSVDKTLFGIGVEKVDDVYKGIQATTRQKASRIGYGILKPIATEGLWEEGLQGATTKTAENWITASYNPKYNNETMALADATYKGLAEQYGTKEGWKEIGIGAIIGGGMSVVLGKGKPQELREFEQQAKYQADYIAPALNKFGDNTAVATELLTKKMMLNSRIKSASDNKIQAIKKGDDVGAILADQDFLVAELQFRKSIGENTKDLVSKYETALNALPKEAWEEAGIENIEDYKQNVIEGYKTLVNNFEKASSFADNVLGETRILGQDVATQQLKDALTYSIVSGQTANRAMDASLVEMAKIIGEDTIKARSVQDTLEKLGKNKQAQVRKLNSQVNQADAEVKKLSDELQKLQVSKDETKGERLAKVQAKLVEANDRLLKVREEREDFAREVSQESKRRRSITSTNIDEVSLTTDFITGEDLSNIDEKLKKIEDTIKSYEGINHEVYYELLDLQKQYKSAKQKFFDYQASVDAIVSGNFAPKFEKMGGLLGKVFNSKEPLNNFSAEFLQDIYNKYVNSVGNLTVEDLTENQYVSDEEYQNFKENGEVSQEVKQKIAERVKQKAELSEREKEIYNSFTQEINNLTKPNPNKPNLLITEEVIEEPVSEAQRMRKEIEKAFEKDYPLLTTDVDELINDKPTKEEIERYLELYPKQEKFDLFEQKEFSELQPRMQKWFMAQSLPVGGLSVADLAELISQLETQIDKEETLTEINDSDLLPFAEEEARAINRVDILQNIAGSAVAKIKDDKIFFIHVNTKGILDKLIQNGAVVKEVQTVNKDGKLNKPKELTIALLNQNASVKGTVFTIGEVKVTIGDRGNVVMTLEDYNKVKDVLNLHYYDSRTGKWSYADLYEQLPDGTKVKKQSEYVTNTNSDNIYEVEQGEDLKPFVDMSTDWNNNLITKALQEIGEDGVISDETKTEVRNSLEITTKSGRNNNSTMKASSQESVDDNFLLIRKRFADKFIETLETEQALATLPKKIELEIEFPVSEIFLGTPEFVLDGSNKPIDFEITERGTENVITQGYVQGSEIVLADKKINLDKVSRLFVSNIAKANPTAKIPVVLLQKGKHQFVFPITLNKTNESQVEKLDAILAKDLTPVEEVKAINNLLISLGSDTRISGLSDIAIEDIKEELENYTTFVSADTLASVEYDKANLSVDATAKIDLEDRLISSPKITVDYSKAVVGTKDQNETDAINLRVDIIKDIVEVRKIVNTTPDMPDGRIVDAFDENDILNQGSDIMNRRDVKYIREMFFNENGRLQLQGKAVDIIGRERLTKIREKLELLEFYENQVKTIKDKETIKKLKCE